MLELAEEKMSKSVGNIVSLREALDTYGREALLVLFLGAHYRSPLEYSEEAMEAARVQAEDFRTAFRVVERTGDAPSLGGAGDGPRRRLQHALALSILHAWRSAGELELLQRGLAIFGLGVESVGDAPPEVVALAEERQAARAGREFDRADSLRAEIARLGWEVQDVSGGFRLIPRA